MWPIKSILWMLLQTTEVIQRLISAGLQRRYHRFACAPLIICSCYPPLILDQAPLWWLVNWVFQMCRLPGQYFHCLPPPLWSVPRQNLIHNPIKRQSLRRGHSQGQKISKASSLGKEGDIWTSPGWLVFPLEAAAVVAISQPTKGC